MDKDQDEIEDLETHATRKFCHEYAEELQKHDVAIKTLGADLKSALNRARAKGVPDAEIRDSALEALTSHAMATNPFKKPDNREAMTADWCFLSNAISEIENAMQYYTNCLEKYPDDRQADAPLPFSLRDDKAKDQRET